MAYCGNCGAERIPGDRHCVSCGRAYDEPRAEPEQGVTSALQSAVAAAESVLPNADEAREDRPFPEWATVAAGALTFFVPFISLIIALVMRSSEQGAKRRRFLKNWAIASGAWLCAGFVFFLIAFSSVGGSSSGGCKGGPDPFGVPSFASTDNKHWTATVPCVGGGTMTRPAKPGEVP